MSDAPSPVVTRFAPSPTGYLHIGGARSALFNWLFAKHNHGRFLLRIEDTDRERSTPEAVEAILQGLRWLGLEGDGAPVFQHANIARHKAVVQQLLDAGAAYRCFMTAEQTEVERERAKAEGRALRSPWRDRADGDASSAHVIRFRSPLDGEVIVEDVVQGTVRWQAKDLDDLVLMRSDGTPTYNLAVVADDHDMGVTHVIRGDDHLNNAARQSLIYKALGWRVPVFAHIPLIHGPDGAKLSKRHGAQAVHEYADMGYLPEAMRNYLARLGWSHGDDELFSDEQAIAWFSLEAINRAPARLDFDKLAHVNAHWIRLADDGRLADLVTARLGDEAIDRERLVRTIGLVKDRASTLLDLETQTRFARQSRPISPGGKAESLLTDEARARLSRLHDHLAQVADWSKDALDAALKDFAAAEGVGFGKIGPVARLVLAGEQAAPDIASTLASLGRDESLARMGDALSL